MQEVSVVNLKNYLWLVFLFVLSLETQASDIDIFTAAEQGNLEAVEGLIQDNPELINAADDRGYSPLHKAAYNNHLNIAEFLISQGANVNATSGSGSTPLHGAAFYGHPEIVRALLENGAELEIANAGGYTPLLSACAGNQSEIVRMLAEKGADINVSPSGGRSPLFQAVWNADAELTKFLLDKGAEADIQTDMGVSLPFFATALRDREFGLMFINKASDCAETDAQGLSMFHYSAARGFTEQIQMLLNRGADLNAIDSLGRTPLFYAALWGHAEVMEILKAHGGTAGDEGRAWFKGDYLGRQAPGRTPVEFVGNELRTPFAPHGRIVFSPDGREMFWCHHAMPIQAMWYSRQINGLWQKPIIAPFTDPTLEYADGNPCFSADGSRVYYHTHRPQVEADGRKDDSDIWYVEKTDAGWRNPAPLGAPVNTDKYEFGPMVAPSGNLYFIGSEYNDTYGFGDIYISEFVNGVYTTPRNLGPTINSEFHELSPVVSSDESYIVFPSNRPHPGGGLNLYVSFKNKSGGWTEAVSFGQAISSGNAWHPFITFDDEYIIYLKDASYYWFSTKVVDDLREVILGPEPDTPPDIVLKKSDQDFGESNTRRLLLEDLDGDSDLDAVFSSGQVWLNNGKGAFTLQQDSMAERSHGVDIGDVDNDGDIDIIFACNSNNMYLNDGKANFTLSDQVFADSSTGSLYVSMVDIDTDGDLDVATYYMGDSSVLYLNDGFGGFSLSDIKLPSTNPYDLDGDGDTDYFVRTKGEGYKVILNDGNGVFREHWSMADSSIDYGFVGFGDIDNDGDPDALVTNGGNDNIYHSLMFINDGSGRFEETDMELPRTRWGNVVFGDLNDDGYLDALITNFTLPNYILINDGMGRLRDSGLRLGGNAGNMLSAIGDLDGDGDVDIFISNFEGGSNEIWFNER
jgi:ankyrin repeat protein